MSLGGTGCASGSIPFGGSCVRLCLVAFPPSGSSLYSLVGGSIPLSAKSSLSSLNHSEKRPSVLRAHMTRLDDISVSGPRPSVTSAKSLLLLEVMSPQVLETGAQTSLKNTIMYVTVTTITISKYLSPPFRFS